MILEELVRDTARRLRAARLHYGHGAANARDETAYLVLRGLGLPFEAPADRPVKPTERARIERLVQRRIRERIPVAQLNSLEKAIEATKPLLANENAETSELKAKGEELQRALHAVSESLYKAESASRAENADAPGQGSRGPDGGNGAQDDGQVVDADFTEEK